MNRFNQNFKILPDDKSSICSSEVLVTETSSCAVEAEACRQVACPSSQSEHVLLQG